ncbi:glycosyltransferase [Polynucleobacter asymbioticus]|uniref:glycosyltransferase n=1 Tax=Polynucleobacter asymbioticus TaxID=576611 RepID=UPI0015CFB516|nr:glycosyltransferase [Polynucleobacter asymbioticus]
MRSKLNPTHRRYIKEAHGYLVLAILWLLSHISRVISYRDPYWRLQSYLLKRTCLFNTEYYLSNYLDVEQQQFDPVYHFAAFGDKEGRQPNPLFDPRFYKSKARGKLKNVNSLLHYFYCGQYRRYSPSAWFDIQFYIANNRDVLSSGYEPLRHYLEFGGVEGRSPNPQFDGKFYLSQHPEIASYGNPLLHFIEYGRLHGLPTRDLGVSADRVDKGGKGKREACINSIEHLDTAQKLYEKILEQFQDSQIYLNNVNGLTPAVDVIIPVYKNTLATLQCISSVMNAKTRGVFELIVINDCSPEIALNEYLQELASLGILTLIENSQNKGFVYSVNRGMQLHWDRDVILLNSDTQVFGNWIDRLSAVSKSDSKIASVTPLSNNATICSYPRTLYDNPYPLEISYEELDYLAIKLHHGKVVEAPTGVGFCLYIKREALKAVGLFDEKAFGIGYGEENDWCQRAIHLGWKNLITANTFVYHIGRSSFGGAKEAQLNRAMKILGKRYPKYHQDIQDFIAKDPLRCVRESLDWARLELQAKRQNTLMVSHNRGGGSERHLQEDAQKAMRNGEGVFYLRPVRAKPHLVRLQHGLVKQLLNLPYFELKSLDLLCQKLKNLNITSIHRHSMVDFEANAPIYLSELAKALQARLIVDIHDYEVICPRINLVDQTGTYCGEPAEEGCNTCLKEFANDFGAKKISEWRNMQHQSLKGAALINVPSYDAINRLGDYYPDLPFKYMPHGPKNFSLESLPISETKVASKEKVRVLIIGAIGTIKGFNVLLGVAQDAINRQLPIQFALQGYSIHNEILEKYDVAISGRYTEHEAVELCKSLSPDIIFYPSIWPETYCYALDIAFSAKKPVMTFDIGAIPERLKKQNWIYRTVPLSNALNFNAINDSILNFYKELHAPSSRDAVIH